MAVREITVDGNKKCAECGKSGATENGLCLACILKAVDGKKMCSETGKAVQKRFDVRMEAKASAR